MNQIDTKICCECNEIIESLGDYVNVNGNDLCRDCYENKYAICHECNKVYNLDGLYSHDGDLYCESCESDKFVMCRQCNESIEIDGAHCVDDYYLCDGCFNGNFNICEGCDEVYHNDNMFYSEGHDACYCESCLPPESQYENVNSYEYRPEYRYYRGINESKNTDKNKNLYFGIELEIESNDGDIESAADNLPDFVYAKEDSSIYEGFEIVSHPCTYQWLKENPEKWNQILNLRKENFSSYNTNTCGIHIHLTKKYFGTLHLYKFLKLFYENPEFILRISQRKQHRLEQYASLQNRDNDESLVYKARNKSGNYERYTAINLQNEYTIEIRIFRGTLNPRSFWKNIEFTKAVVEFTRDAALKDITVLKFMPFVAKHKTEYINLYNWLFDKGFYQDSLSE